MKDDEGNLTCWALVNGVDVWLWDVQGVPRRFNLSSGKSPGHAKQSNKELCFVSHNNNNQNSSVDDLLTPCFDENGRHGFPAEDCFCGEKEPHLHAHWHNPQGCQNDNSSSEDSIQRLANVMLLRHDSDDTKEEEKEPSSSSFRLSSVAMQHGWPCPNARHLVRQDTSLIWQAEPCADCTDQVLNEPSSRPTPLFRHNGSRAWKDANTKRSVTLHFFHLSDCEENITAENNPEAGSIAKASCAKSNRYASSSDHQSEKSSCCASSQSTEKDFSTKTAASCCEGSAACCNRESQVKKSSGGQDNAPDCCQSKTSTCCGNEGRKIKTEEKRSCCDESDCCDKTLASSCCSKHSSQESCCSDKHKEVTLAPCSENTTVKKPCGKSEGLCCTKRTLEGEANGYNDADCSSPCCDTREQTKTSSCCSSKNSTRSLCCTEESCCGSKKPLKEDADLHNTTERSSPCCDKGEQMNSTSCCSAKNSKGSSSCCAQESNDKSGSQCADSGCCSSRNKFPSAEHAVAQAGRSQLRVVGICCASEIPVIQKALGGIDGIQKVAVNPTTKTVYVDHDVSLVSANHIASLLNRRGMGAEVQIDAATMSEKKEQSLFVVSKFELFEICGEKFNAENYERVNLVLKAYDGTEVESVAFDELSNILTVIHNPWTLGTEDIAKEIQEKANAHPKVLLNGSNQNRAPLDYASLAALKEAETEDTGATQEGKWPRANVIMSGLLWIVSMLSFIGGDFNYLKYVALASVAFGLPPIARKALGTLSQQFCFDANGLMLMASIGALALGEFPEAGAVVFLFALSEWLERRASSRARQALSAIAQLRPDKARIIDPETQELWTVPATAVPVGALVSVKTGDKIPCDGIVVEGQSTVDESSLTGESRPIAKGPKSCVSGGTVNTGLRQLVIRTTSSADDSAVARLIRLVEEAQLNRSETEKSIDEFAKIYTPMVLLAATFMCTIPWAYGSETGRKWTHNGLVLIVVACPCALIISTPVTYVAGLAATAQKGVLIKGGAFLEALGRVQHICFDKTGTLTTGEFCLLHFDTVGDFLSRRQVLEYLLLMEERAAHPVAQAITTAAKNENVSIPKDMILEKHTILAGEGVTGVINGTDVFVGNERLFERLGLLLSVPSDVVQRVDSWKKLGGTIGYVSVQGAGIVGAFCASDAVRPEAAEVVHQFRKRGIALTMLTGDNQEAAESVGSQLDWHCDKNTIYAKLLPADKLKYVRMLNESANRHSGKCFQKKTVMFCGDGVNDAPALAAAHIGVAMGSGAVVAMETAHVTLLDTSLYKLDFAQRMGRRVLRKIMENVIFSISVKAAVLVWALTGTPSLWAAIGSDVGSMLLVTLNSLRLLPKQRKAEPTSDFAKFA